MADQHTQGETLVAAPTRKFKARAGRIMYIECKTGDLTGPARIGRVTFSQTGRTLYYRGQRFQSLKGLGFKANYYDLDTGEEYWISGPKRNGKDAALVARAGLKMLRRGRPYASIGVGDKLVSGLSTVVPRSLVPVMIKPFMDRFATR